MTTASYFTKTLLFHAAKQMVPHAQRIGHDSQSRVDGAARWEEAGVDNIEVVHIMRLAVGIEGRRLGVAAKANGAVLVRYSGQRNTLADEQVAREEPLETFVGVNRALGLLLHQALKLGDQPLVTLFVIRLVAEDDVTVAVYGHAIVRIRQVFRGEPKVKRVLSHDFEREAGSDGRRARLERFPIQLADKRNVAHGVVPLFRTEVEVVDRERLLKDRRIRALVNSHEDRINVPHVVPSDHVRTVCQAVWVFVVGGAQQQRGGINGST